MPRKTSPNSLRKRPMRRVIEPLRQMGAEIRSQEGDRAPIEIRGGRLHAIDYTPPIPSAQVKSAVLLAGLVLNSLFGWCWADPIAALVIAAVALREGVQAWRGRSCCEQEMG